MSDPKVYRMHALRCAELAQAAKSPSVRELLFDLTKTWLNLAAERERTHICGTRRMPLITARAEPARPQQLPRS